MPILNKDTVFQSNQTYVAEEKRIDCTKADTVCHHFNRCTADDIVFYLENLENVTLDFAGATLYVYGKIQPIVIKDCKNVTIKNLTVKFNRASVTEGKILEADKTFMRVRLNPHHPCKVADGQLVPYCDEWENTAVNASLSFRLAYDKDNNCAGFCLGAIGKDLCYDKTLPWSKGCQEWSVEADGDDVIFRGTDIPDCFAAGNTLVICHEKRNVTGITAFGGENLTIENFRLINGVGMGIYLYHIQNVTIDGYVLTAEKETGTVTSNGADGLHTYSIGGKFEVRNSVFEGMVDDALNVHSQFYLVERIEDNTIIAKCGGNDTTAVDIFAVGDTMRVYKGLTLEKAEDYTITGMEVLDLDYVRFTVDKPIAAHQKGDAILNLSGMCDLHIEHCRFGKAAVAHLRLQNGGNCLIENCETACQFCLTGDLSYWFESYPVASFEARNVSFTRHANVETTPEFFPTEQEPYYHGDVYVHDCTFERDLVFDGRMTKSITYENIKNTLGREMLVKAKNCGPVTAPDCKVEEIREEITDLKFN